MTPKWWFSFVGSVFHLVGAGVLLGEFEARLAEYLGA